MRHGPPDFMRSEIRRAAGEIVIYAGQPHARVDGDRSGTKLEIEICRLVQRTRIRTRRRHFHKDVVVHEDAMFILTCSVAVFLECFESTDLSRLGLELSLLLGRKLSILTRKIGQHLARRRAPFERKFRAFVWPEAIV